MQVIVTFARVMLLVLWGVAIYSRLIGGEAVASDRPAAETPARPDS